MWLCFPSAFLSIVHKPPCGPGELLVRARRPGDIESVFPKAKVVRSTDTDYLYRAVIRKVDVSRALAKAADDIDYPNFKNTVQDTGLHEAYFEVWASMAKVQPLPPYSGVLPPDHGARSLPR
jgi:hypothetical protein